MTPTRILSPNVPNEISESFLAKIAFDWLFFDYLQNLPPAAHQLAFLSPFFIKKPGDWQTPWEQLWAEVFPTPIYHGGQEFSREFLLQSYDHDKELLLRDIHACLKNVTEKREQQGLEVISLEMFLEEYFEETMSLREITETEKRIIAKAIKIGSIEAKILARQLKLPRSTTYAALNRCWMRLHLKETAYLKEYCLGLEPILLFFPKVREAEANFIEHQFRRAPYFYNSGRLIPENKRANREKSILLINLRFPSRFKYKLRWWVKKFIEAQNFPKVHWLTYDRFEHGYDLWRYGINVKKDRSFNLRGGVIAKRVILHPGDLKILGHRLRFGRWPVLPMRDIERITGIPAHVAFAAEKRLLPQLNAGEDIFIMLNHLSPVRDFRLLLRDPDLDEFRYFRTFPEHYFYHDLNDLELLVLLMIPQERIRELRAFLAEHPDRVILSGFNREHLYTHIFTLADLEEEYDYTQNEWKDPFKPHEWWQWESKHHPDEERVGTEVRIAND